MSSLFWNSLLKFCHKSSVLCLPNQFSGTLEQNSHYHNLASNKNLTYLLMNDNEFDEKLKSGAN